MEQAVDDLPKEVVDHIFKEETRAHRKANWEKIFEKVSIFYPSSHENLQKLKNQIFFPRVHFVPKIDVYLP